MSPRMAGLFAKVFVWFLEMKLIGNILLYFLKKNNRIQSLVSYGVLEESPLYVPLHTYEDVEEEEVKCLDRGMSPAEQVQHAMDCLQSSDTVLHDSSFSFCRWTILDYSRAYAKRQITPLVVAERLISAVVQSSSPGMDMSFFIRYDAQDILRQAAESTLRHERGESISVLDGVPIAVKDEIDCMPHPTTGGSKWLHKVRPCKEDACCVKRLRSCGAILVGKTNMHELGAGTSGINPHYGSARNPYDPRRISGGSSSGSAAVVCAGLCPVALGVDGGGSVRMPAALCGVIGLKPSFGRIPHSGVLPLNWTVGMVGILAGTVEDSLIVYAAISGQAESHQPTMPRVHLPMLKPSNMSRITLAKSNEWFNDCSDDIRACCLHALASLHKSYGWETYEVTLPDIEVMRLAHYVTIGSECSASIAHHLEKMGKSVSGWDVRVALSIYGSFDSRDYLNAQRIRNRQMKFYETIFRLADVIVSPMVGVTAYEIKEDAQETGELDYVNGAALVRYSIAGNFLGFPAVTVPVGYDRLGLPIGIQFIGKPWSEAKLIQIAYAMEALCKAEYKKPKVFYDLLGES
ncbi:fatty acid amide hydrolase-like isoform X2 [Cynara cardunculus var. scolymus]|uniref:fatty acid amide hydrolase-like isoform X2 n=1 Tax=Cynara cardunculus var. scolymus TaxID=59895 RepID=UPI000D62A5BD|nr:fatty acid amide hydrolase-like isoform X2 [Cynara cardunculus var. scolymus]